MYTLNHRIFNVLGGAGLLLMVSATSVAGSKDLKVMITPQLASVTVVHKGKNVTIQRNQNSNHTIRKDLTLTSRECPPHCVQPIRIPGIQTIGEIELLGYLKKASDGDISVLVVDTRSEEIAAQGTIPGSINIFGNHLIAEQGANPITIEEILTTQFGVAGEEGAWDFSQAKTLVLYCYGIWCGQAPRTINALIKLGYPKNKLKWYRGGMQAWEGLGLTTMREKP